MTGVGLHTSVTVSGRNEIAGTIEAAINAVIRRFDGIEVAIVAGGDDRSASQNALIAKVQAGKKPFPSGKRTARDPFYVDQQASETIRFSVRGLTAESPGTQRKALDTITKAMIESVNRNVEKQQNPNGAPFTALTLSYAAFKRRRFGFTTPIVRASGDLLDNLSVRITAAR